MSKEWPVFMHMTGTNVRMVLDAPMRLSDAERLGMRQDQVQKREHGMEGTFINFHEPCKRKGRFVKALYNIATDPALKTDEERHARELRLRNHELFGSTFRIYVPENEESVEISRADHAEFAKFKKRQAEKEKATT